MKGKVKECSNPYCGAKYALGLIEEDGRNLYNRHGFRYCPVCGIRQSKTKQ